MSIIEQTHASHFLGKMIKGFNTLKQILKSKWRNGANQIMCMSGSLLSSRSILLQHYWIDWFSEFAGGIGDTSLIM